MATDKLNISQFAEMAGMDESFIRSTPDVLKLVRKAISQDWLSSAQGKANFQRDFENTKWYKNNASWARRYLMAEAQGSEDFKQKRLTTAEAIKARAVALGADLDDAAVESLTTAYFMNGWGEQGREGMLDKALTGELEDFDVSYLNFTKGGSDAIITKLKSNARANGLDYTDDYYTGAATRVLSGQAMLNDYIGEQRRLAATADPLNASRIMAGETRRDIYAPYITTYAKMFDKDPNSVDLNDKNLKIAFNTLDKDGKPTAMGLWDYEKALRKTDEWAYTSMAHEEVSNLTREITRMFGFGG